MKKPFVYALTAAVYIVLVVTVMQTLSYLVPGTYLVPIGILGLFVLSAAIMGFLFLYEPLRLFMEGQKQEAVSFFLKIVGTFAGFLVLFLIFLILR